MSNPSNSVKPSQQDPEFDKFIDAAVSRRGFLCGASATGAATFLGMSPIAQAVAGQNTKSTLMGFEALPASTADAVIVPKGYKAEILVSWGDAIFPKTAGFSQSAASTDQDRQFGDNNDGMTFFPISESRAVLAVNNEYTNLEYMFAHGGKAMTADDVRKDQAGHGVTVVELKKEQAGWKINPNGELNRRITAYTPMEITGPAAGHKVMQTAADKSGRKALGTFNNCANGETPWGTYLTCEENFNKYFGTEGEANLTDTHKRYGLKAKPGKGDWNKFDERFDLAKNPNEPHRFGWIVEIDPMDPSSTPKKRTALGRFKHENAALTVNKDGRIVVYMGDDERGEHLYKFVSKNKIDAANPKSQPGLLDDGTLYVAKFDSKNGEQKGAGQWLELTWGKNGLTAENGFADQAEVLVFARKAATQVGATTMDRPEWVAVHPSNKHVCCTLTNNKYRGIKDNQPIDGVNPREENPYGHIVRWAPKDGDHAADTFGWDLFLIAGNPKVNKEGLMAGSTNINEENMFNSPDGIGFDKAGRLWIQTDGKYSNEGKFEGMGNNQMLCADPATGEVRRFLTGPVACEVTGLTFTPDYKTMFIGIQHPGERLAKSHFPDGGKSIPRSSVVMITKDDGGVIGT